MIATFPLFSKLTASHKHEVKAIVSQFDPYSDFNFTSLFCWDIDNSLEISNLNNNLVIKFPDYITGQPAYSILGQHNIDASMAELLEITDTTTLVPEIVIKQLQRPQNFAISEDRDGYDYIYDLEKIATLSGSEFKGKRKKYSQFYRTYADSLKLEEVDLGSDATRKDIEEIFSAWMQERGKPDIETTHEQTAVGRMLLHSELFNVHAHIITIDEKPVGFSINEILNEKYAVCHFHKSLLNYEFIDTYFSSAIGKYLWDHGCKYVNWEQDLGLPGLRTLKLSYFPDFFLRKYSVRRIT